MTKFWKIDLIVYQILSFLPITEWTTFRLVHPIWKDVVDRFSFVGPKWEFFHNLIKHYPQKVIDEDFNYKKSEYCHQLGCFVLPKLLKNQNLWILNLSSHKYIKASFVIPFEIKFNNDQKYICKSFWRIYTIPKEFTNDNINHVVVVIESIQKVVVVDITQPFKPNFYELSSKTHKVEQNLFPIHNFFIERLPYFLDSEDYLIRYDELPFFNKETFDHQLIQPWKKSENFCNYEIRYSNNTMIQLRYNPRDPSEISLCAISIENELIFIHENVIAAKYFMGLIYFEIINSKFMCFFKNGCYFIVYDLDQFDIYLELKASINIDEQKMVFLQMKTFGDYFVSVNYVDAINFKQTAIFLIDLLKKTCIRIDNYFLFNFPFHVYQDNEKIFVLIKKSNGMLRNEFIEICKKDIDIPIDFLLKTSI